MRLQMAYRYLNEFKEKAHFLAVVLDLFLSSQYILGNTPRALPSLFNCFFGSLKILSSQMKRNPPISFLLLCRSPV